MIRKSSIVNIKFLVYFFYVLHGLNTCHGIQFQGVVDLIHNFEAMDPEVLNLFTFRNKPAYRNREDANEIDIMDIDTSDILNCFSSLSYNCFQKKILIYLDSLNRVDKINLFGGYLSFVRVSKGLNPPITEQLLASRHITDEQTLSRLLKEVFEDFVESHILRIHVPMLNTKLEARSARGHCYDFNLADAKLANDTSKDTEAAKEPTCYRGDNGMVALSSALVVKMMMILPTLLKIIAAKALFGLAMGMVSVVLSKLALLPILLSYTNKGAQHANTANNAGGAAGVGVGGVGAGLGAGLGVGAGSYRQGVNQATNFALTTDNYNTYFPQEEQPGRLTTAVAGLENDISADYGPTAISSDNLWADNKMYNKNYNVQNKDLKQYVPRKERYRAIYRRHISKPKRPTYSDVFANGRYIDDVNLLTTTETITDRIDQPRSFSESPSNLTARIKRWFKGPSHGSERSI